MKYVIYICIFFSLFSFACEDIFIGAQPKFIEKSDASESLNIFGVIRPDSLYGKPASFINVSIMAPVINDTNESWLIKDAEINIHQIDLGQFVDTFNFHYDTNQLGQEQYLNYDFHPHALNTYYITCYKQGFDTIKGYVRIPGKADVVDLEFSKGSLTISINNNPDIKLYDLYFFNEEGEQINKSPVNILSNPDAEVLSIIVETGIKPAYIEIYSFDENLAAYYGLTNVFVKPNTYREPFSTVQNGFGCIGAMNKLVVFPE